MLIKVSKCPFYVILPSFKMPATIGKKLFLLIEILQNLYFPLIEYASRIKLFPIFPEIVKIEIKFTPECGDEQILTFEKAELETINMRGQAKRKMIELEETMRRVAMDIQNAEAGMDKEI
jgi:hypothetical protein